jgi:hypothetical protein
VDPVPDPLLLRKAPNTLDDVKNPVSETRTALLDPVYNKQYKR